MKLIINTASTYKGGGVQVAYSFIEECKKFTENEYHIILGDMVGNLVNESEFPSNFTFYRIGYRPATRVFSLFSHDGFFKKLEKEIRPDVVFTTSGPAYWRPEAPHLTGYNLPHYIYRDSPYFDTMPLYKKLKWDGKGRILKFFFKRDADAYVVQTNDVNKRVRKLLSTDKVFTVTNACSNFYHKPVYKEKKLPERKPGEFRFLSLSAWYPHKNLV
ncbi:MAG: mannosyltransferase, partial [Balneolaceae bacterium]